ncbi:DUF3865 domain-containing protein [Streptomyces sp. NPDC020799]|uniref:DUF3865 domain-containing protein n=1 Tax=Streptomyces sp. NPDC020799 TaxID=3365091 RepID=UPI00378BC994
MGTLTVASMDRRITSLWNEVSDTLKLHERTPREMRFLIHEHSVFSRENPAFLSMAEKSSRAVPELARELRRNYLEESGDGDQLGHFSLYSEGLRRSFGFRVDEHVPSAPTVRFVDGILGLASLGDESVACGAFYATEAAAIPELELMQEIVEMYAQRRGLKADVTVKEFFALHLNGVEQEHRDGIAVFIHEADDYGLEVDGIECGFDGAARAMHTWWKGLAASLG